ncbi:MAG: alanine--tRNA ligase [Oscillospiraceae bacterium]|jgi:alanyl-tRNA synthetase|nr:alanine--tRNA ligase [Oscillospiraceae bacterium]
MKPYGLNELREMFLTYFESKGHLRLPSFSLIPSGDKSLLLINSGMAPMKSWFKGIEPPPRVRVTTCQKCVRTGDIENIGKTDRHGTYFEMLGNFSFGDYFKSDAIAFSWEFLTEVVGMEPEKLYPSVYVEDDDAYAIWTDEIGIPDERMTRLGKADNFWEHGAGPCGPCSEIYYDRGEEHGCGSPDCRPGCDCDRFIEIWNNVFTQFDNDGKNNYTELTQKNIDTGMGLERLAVVCQGVKSLFDVDTIMRITNKISEITRAKYGESAKTDTSLRIITDHTRASCMMIADGVLPSNEGRGYVLRRLLRRAARHGRLLGVTEPFLRDVVETVIEVNEGAYPEVRERAEHIFRVVATEEDNFNKTLDNGLEILNNVIANLGTATVIAGDDAFRLYDTYGFPIDLTAELAEERGLTVDTVRFDELMQEQRSRAREARKALGDFAWEGIDFGADTEPTEFVGYESDEIKATITAIIIDGALEDSITDGMRGIIVLDRTPLYAEMGGQVGDKGEIGNGKFITNVDDVKKTKGGKYLHRVVPSSLPDSINKFNVGDAVTVKVSPKYRDAIRRAHSATHLLHSALRNMLGDHVTQAGSLVEPDYLRFDFTNMEAVDTESVEEMVNSWILAGYGIETAEKSVEQAKADGATALFGEKYGDTVRVVTMGGVSMELCGGTHLDNTAKVGSFRIVSEFSVASGVRRIEAITGNKALAAADTDRESLNKIGAALKANTPDEILLKIEQQASELRELRRAAEQTAAQNASDSVKSVDKTAFGAFNVVFLHDVTSDLRQVGDALAVDENIVAVLASRDGDSVKFLAVCGKNAVKNGANAGKLIKQFTPKGGGKPESAMGGGTEIPTDGAEIIIKYLGGL